MQTFNRRYADVLAAGLAMTLMLGSSSLALAAGTDPLAGLAWKVRPLVVVADEAGDPRFQRQIASLQARAPDLADYDIKLIAVTAETAGIRRKLRLPATGFAVALVGKDGGVKQIWHAPVDPGRIFALIETMPMRRDEVRRRTSG